MARSSPPSKSGTKSQKPDQATRPRVTRQDMDRLFRGPSLDRIEWRLKQKLHVSGEDMAAAIEADATQTLSDEVRTHLCLLLRGQVKNKRGPKASHSMAREVILTMAQFAYDAELLRQQAQQKKSGLRGRGHIAPHERAINAVREQLPILGSVTPRRLANILSARKFSK